MQNKTYQHIFLRNADVAICIFMQECILLVQIFCMPKLGTVFGGHGMVRPASTRRSHSCLLSWRLKHVWIPHPENPLPKMVKVSKMFDYSINGLWIFDNEEMQKLFRWIYIWFSSDWLSKSVQKISRKRCVLQFVLVQIYPIHLMSGIISNWNSFFIHVWWLLIHNNNDDYLSIIIMIVLMIKLLSLYCSQNSRILINCLI